VLATEYNAGDAVSSATLKEETQGKNKFKRTIFTSGLNGDAIRVYFYKEGDHDVALVWDVPQALEKTTATPISLCLQCFSVGRRAGNFFNNGYSDEGMGGGGAGGAGKGGAPAF
jgi:hypothetical protein